MEPADLKAGGRSLSVKEVITTNLDRDGNGTIDVAELVQLLQGVERGNQERKYMAFAIVAMFVFGLILIGAIVGLSYAVVYSLKDSQVKGGIMYVKNSDGAAQDIVRTGSAEFGIENGLFVQRVATDTAAVAGTKVAATVDAAAPVVQTAVYMGTPQPLNSEVDIEYLLQLKYLLVNGTGKAQLGLVVLGVARVPLEGSVHSTVLHIITAAGTITLDGTAISFSTAIANIFAEAGFRVSSSRRALLGTWV
ncbi:hypothetical protein GPECTOR_58g566 [Gonium pectorale]|uniref:EF-hand domain-containing protein n=1 Tax=Gonium pectorale TaxID=33097 RepID=A0A150G5J4_GONPE|nr:hypothetical protein GPECTOR_58g566 [Gonium pectorale]|eukprot:KXZ45117.1 hypothetical protein GPECTOR_58g566 [Gonium pectorale]